MRQATGVIRQAIDDILGDPKGAFICLLPFIAITAVMVATNLLAVNLFSDTQVSPDDLAWLRRIAIGVMLVVTALLFVAVSWTAIAWDRMIILSERYSKLPRIPLRALVRHIARSIVLTVIILLLMVPVAIGLLLITSEFQLSVGGGQIPFFIGVSSPGYAPSVILILLVVNVLMLAILGFYAGLFLRMSLVLPALSIGRPQLSRDIWLVTKGHFWSLFFPIGTVLVVIASAFGLLNSTLSFGGVVGIVTDSIMFMLGVSVLTRLYTHFFPEAPTPER